MLGLALLIFVPPLLILLALETGPGQRFAADQLTQLLSGPDGGIEISELGGSLWDRLTVGKVVMSDSEGAWLTVEGVTLDWSPFALLSSEASVRLLEVQRVDMPRPPEPSGDSQPSTETSASDDKLIPELPSLPVDVVVDRLEVGEVALGAPLVGVAAGFSVKGDALWPQEGETRLTLDVNGTGETKLWVKADLGWTPSDEVLDLSVEVQEPEGGLISRLADLPSLPAIDLTLAGKGSLDDWQGKLRLALNGTEAVKGDLTLAGQPKRRVVLIGRVDPSGTLPADLLPEDLRPWLEGGALLDVAADLDDELVTIERLNLDAAAIAVALKGSLALESEEVDAELTVTLDADSPLRDMVPDISLGASSLQATVKGPLSLPEARLTAKVAGLKTAEAEVQSLDLHLEANPQDGQVAATLDLQVKGPKVLLAEVPPLPYGDLRLNAAALVSPDEGSAVLQRLSLRGTDLTLRVDGDLSLPQIAGTPQLHLEAVLPDLGGFEPMLAGLPLSVTLDSGLSLDGLEQPIAANIDATVVGTGGLPDGIGSLLGDGLMLMGGVTYAPDGSIALSDVSLLGPHLAVDLDGEVGSEAMALKWQVALDDLAKAEPLIGSPASGALNASGDFQQAADGRLSVSALLEGKDLAFGGELIGPLSGEVDIAGLPPELSGDIKLSAPKSGYGPIDISASLAPVGTEAFRIAPLTVALGGEVQISGGLTVPAAGTPISGELRGTLNGGKLLANLGVPLQGRGTLAVELIGQGEQQDVKAALNLAPGRLADVAHGGMALKADVRDATGALRLDGSLTASGVNADPARLETLAVTFKGTPENLAVTLETSGDVEGPTQLSIAGQVRQQGSRTSITLSRLTGKLAGLPLSQTKNTEVAIGPAGPESASLGLQVAGASLTLDAKLAGRDKRLVLDLTSLDLKDIESVIGDDAPEGTIAARIDLRGDRQAQGTISVTASGLSVQEEGLPVNPPVDIALNGALSGNGLAVNGELSGQFGQPMRLQALVPLRVSLSPIDAQLSETAPLSASLDWTGELGPLVDLAPVGEQRVTGQTTIDLAVAGTMANPQVSGIVKIVGGRYENILTSTIVENLTVTLQGSDRRLVVQQFSGTDGQNGRLNLTGAFNLAGDPGPSLNAELTLTDFALARREDLYARMDADIKVDGNLAEQLKVAGTITNREIRASVQPDLPASIPDLPVTLVRHGEPVDGSAAQEDEDEEPALPILLDITVDLPRRVFVAGAGLDSEWTGKLFIRGTADEPFITGKLEPRRGLFSLFGSQFELKEGSVDFDGSAKIDPTFNLKAVHEGDDFEATIAITGSAAKPEINLTSDPEMPEDEILSNVLFGRGTGQISPVEALQLAEAAAIMSGATGTKKTTVEFIRDSLGVDVLRVEAGEGDNEAVATVGEYISKDVFVGVRQGTQPGSTQATVEVDLLPNVKFEGRAAAGDDPDTNSSAIIRWEFDY